MLSRAICRRCRNEVARQTDPRTGERIGGAWTPNDDELWGRGRHVCLGDGTARMLEDCHVTPSWCRYAAEHVVSQ